MNSIYWGVFYYGEIKTKLIQHYILHSYYRFDNCYNNLTYEEYCLKPCNESHENCSTCDRQGNCLSCLGNKTHGSSCDLSCENCPDGLCDFDRR